MSESRDVLSRAARPADLSWNDDPSGDDAHAVDVWLPMNRGATHPLVIFFHGGFWRPEYDRRHVAPLAEALAAEGFVVATPEYRRGEGPDAMFADVLHAIRTIPQRLAADIALGSVILAGHSAGGHLAVWASRQEDIGEIAGVVALAPVLDLREADRRDLGEGATRAFLEVSPEDDPARWDAADPMAIGGDQPPVIVVHGDADIRVPIDLSRGYRDRLGGRLIELPATDHFAVIDPQSSAWTSVRAAFRTW